MQSSKDSSRSTGLGGSCLVLDGCPPVDVSHINLNVWTALHSSLEYCFVTLIAPSKADDVLSEIWAMKGIRRCS